MKPLPTHQRGEPVVLERLEARLLLAAAPCIQPDGPMPQAAGPGCGSPAEEMSQAADVDGDGKLSLNDAKTNAVGEPTSLTFNGRGIDLNEDQKVDALAAASGAEFGLPSGAAGNTADLRYGVHRPDSRDIDTFSPEAGDGSFKGPYVVDLLSTQVDVPADSACQRGHADGFITGSERCNLAPPDALGPADEPARFSGAQAFLRGRVVDLAVEGAGRALAATAHDYETGLARKHRPFVVGYFEDWHYSAGQQPVTPPTSLCVCRYNLVAEVAGLSPAAGHCKIMPLRVANPECPAGGPFGAVMGGIGGLLG